MPTTVEHFKNETLVKIAGNAYIRFPADMPPPGSNTRYDPAHQWFLLVGLLKKRGVYENLFQQLERATGDGRHWIITPPYYQDVERLRSVDEIPDSKGIVLSLMIVFGDNAKKLVKGEAVEVYWIGGGLCLETRVRASDHYELIFSSHT